MPVTTTEPDVESKPLALDVASTAVSLLKVSATPEPLVTMGTERFTVLLPLEKPTTEVLGAMPAPETVSPVRLASVPVVFI